MVDSIDQGNTLYYSLLIWSLHYDQLAQHGLLPEEKLNVWSRWRSGQSLSSIGRALNKHPASIFGMLRLQGGITPTIRHRSSRTLSIDERGNIARDCGWAFDAKYCESIGSLSLHSVSRDQSTWRYQQLSCDSRRCMSVGFRQATQVLSVSPEQTFEEDCF